MLEAPERPHKPITSSFDMREYLQLIIARWRLLAIVVALTTSIALLHFYITPAEYRASTLLQIEQRSPLALNDESNPYLEAFLTQKYYPTQYELLRSRGIAERVVQSLDLGADLGLDSPDFALGGSEATDATELARLARRLLGGIKVTPILNTELVSLSYTSSDPERAAELANAFAREYISWSIESRSDVVSKTSTFLGIELQNVNEELQQKEEQLEEYSRLADIVTLDPASNPTLQRLDSLNSQLLNAQGALREKEARYRDLPELPRDRVADDESNGLITELRRERLRKQADYDAKLQIYKPDWPAMVELKAAIEDGERAYSQAVDKHYADAESRYRAEYSAARSQVRRIEREIDQVKSEAMDLSSASIEYNNLRMEIEARRAKKDDILRQLSAANTSARMFRQRESNVRVVEQALVPTRSFRPSLRLDLGTGVSGGLALGIGLILLLHFLDRTIKTPEEMEKLLGLPLLGVIPDVSETSKGYGLAGYYGYRRRSQAAQAGDSVRQIELLPAVHPRQAVSEAYRSLRTALLLSSAEKLNLISITSAESGEGKTATAANLGTVLAQLGKRVLLVDGDLRKPRMFKVFEVSNRAGLVNFLTSSAQPESLVLQTNVDNLFLCPAGPHPPNPSELLASDRMRAFLSFAQANYDFVIVDTPPVLAVTDAVLVGAMCHGVVLCFRANKAARDDLQTCRDRLLRAEVRILGTVLNRYAPTRSGGYGRRYYYYESYGEEVESSSAA